MVGRLDRGQQSDTRTQCDVCRKLISASTFPKHWRRCHKVSDWDRCVCGRVKPCSNTECGQYKEFIYIPCVRKGPRNIAELEQRADGWALRRAVEYLAPMVEDGLTLEQAVAILAEMSAAKLA